MTLKIQRSRSWPRSNPLVTFEAWSSIDMFAFRFVAIFWLRYSEFNIWPWKFKIKVITKVKPDGHIWGLEFNWYVCVLFCGNWTIFWLRYSKFHIWPWKIKVKVKMKIDQNLISCSIGQCQQSCHKWKKSKELIKSYRMNKSLRSAHELVQNIRSPPMYRVDLITNPRWDCR